MGNVLIVRYDEIGLKSARAERELQRKLSQNITNAVQCGRIVAEPGRLFVHDCADAAGIARVFGVKSVSPAKELQKDIAGITKTVLDIPVNSTFAVRARRVKSFPLTSKQLEEQLGTEILAKWKDSRVNLTNPELTIGIEVRERAAYVFTETVPGVGGLPQGCQGKVAVLFSGGMDSPVAAWMAAKRGCTPVFVFINFGNDEHAELVARVAAALSSQWNISPRWHVIDGKKIAAELVEKINAQAVQVVLKRIMYKIAEHVARKEGCHAIITGESIGQVSSQTLKNLKVIDAVTELPVLRPLIGLDKSEIMRIARTIGTYEHSAKVPELCGLGKHASPDVPETLALSEEQKLNLTIAQIVSTPAENLAPQTLENAVVIDVHQLASLQPALNKNQKYVFVCPHGMLSATFARVYRQKGYDAYALSRQEYEKIRKKQEAIAS